MVGFRGGCLSGLSPVLGRDFHEKSRFSQNSCCVFGAVLEAPRVGFGKAWARFDAISARSGGDFGADPSYITL